jgi:quercetin dioxygenase-like cupin family protein
MRVIESEKLRTRAIDEHGSRGALVTHLASRRGSWSVVQMRLEPGGVLGMHPAAQDQLFFIVSGGGVVREASSEPVPLGAGSAVLLSSGEAHETRAGPEGLVAMVIEGDSLAETLLLAPDAN